VPSYCDVGYIYDKIENICIKDDCFKKEEFNKFYYDHYKKTEIKNVAIVTKILIGIFLLFQIVLAIILFTKRFKKIKNKKRFVIIIIALETILIIVLYIFYKLEIKGII